MKKLNQNGFSAIEAVLLLVIIGIIGGTGYYVYSASNKTNQTYDSATKTSQPAVNKKAKTAPSYLTIEQWGVRITLSDISQGAYYQIRSEDKSDPPTFLDVFSTKADAIKGPKGVACQGEYIAYLMRKPKTDPAWNDPLTGGYFGVRKDIGDTRYAIATKKTYGPMCFNKNDATDSYSVDEATGAAFDKIVKAFAADFKTIELVPKQ